ITPRPPPPRRGRGGPGATGPAGGAAPRSAGAGADRQDPNRAIGVPSARRGARGRVVVPHLFAGRRARARHAPAAPCHNARDRRVLGWTIRTPEPRGPRCTVSSPPPGAVPVSLPPDRGRGHGG